MGGNENHTEPGCCPTGKVSRGNVKTAKSCHNGNDLGGRWNPHEMSGSDVIAPEVSGLAGSYCARGGRTAQCSALRVI